MNKPKFYILVLCLSAAVLFTGCTTPGFLKPVHWKKDKTPVDYAIDHYELGQKYELEGNREKAIEEYQTSLKLSPRPIVYYKLGLLYAAQGNYAEAKTSLQKAIELSPTFEDAKKELNTLSNMQTSISADTASMDTTAKDTTSSDTTGK